MARRKDHTRPELKEFIRTQAENLIKTKGFDHLTARALAAHIGYSAGTIYNVYPDMEALKEDINFHTLGRLQAVCIQSLEGASPGISKLRALANAYITFAQAEPRFWSLIFTGQRHDTKKERLPKEYRARLTELFELIERTIHDHGQVNIDNAPKMARLLWACLHGVTTLTLDGRLMLVDAEPSNDLINLLFNQFLVTPSGE